MRRRVAYGLAVLLSVASLGAGAAGGPNSSEAGSTQMRAIPKDAWVVKVQPKHRSKPYQVGTASWYGAYFEGKPTASGEPYDMHDLTAAHPTLPLGTVVRVTNLRNGRSVIVRVNDRGPVVDGRIIDLSYNAAKAIDMKSRGIQRVRLDLVPTTTIAMAQPVSALR
ncbi:MAG: septal ring lytic transglycosylase RlpA family lipoprotein [Acidobacteria bacterium]|nr:MAG: septal ring lytic transglycosylase RlpA family lipoprotein [Acidobacteriota bacterium]